LGNDNFVAKVNNVCVLRSQQRVGHSKGSQRWPCLIREPLPFDKINMFAGSAYSIYVCVM